jgi:hypothetical protein
MAANAICLFIDGLHPGMIGAYGNDWVETPNLDRLAVESFVADQYLIDSFDPDLFLRSVLTGRLPLLGDDAEAFDALSLTQRKNVQSAFVTDVPEQADIARRHRFENVITLAPSTSDSSADSIEETHFLSAFSEIVDILIDESESERDDDLDRSLLLCCHLAGMSGPWDAPLAEREKYREEDDPEPMEGVTPPSLLLPPDFDPDDLLRLTHAYTAQIATMDACLGGLLEWLETSGALDDTLLIVSSPRSFPLGEHRRVGLGEKEPYTEFRHVPLMVRVPDMSGASVRSQALLRPADLYTTLDDWFSSDEATKGLFPLIREEAETIRQRLVLVGPNREISFRTPAWLMRPKDVRLASDAVEIPVDDGTEDETVWSLFAKPDDHWEVNDVADRCVRIVEELVEACDETVAAINSGPDAESALLPLSDDLVEGLE